MEARPIFASLLLAVTFDVQLEPFSARPHVYLEPVKNGKKPVSITVPVMAGEIVCWKFQNYEQCFLAANDGSVERAGAIGVAIMSCFCLTPRWVVAHFGPPGPPFFGDGLVFCLAPEPWPEEKACYAQTLLRPTLEKTCSFWMRWCR
jgi:hypothetical protein